MRKIKKTSGKSTHALSCAMLGVVAAAFVGTVVALIVKSRNEDKRFREYLADALDEEFQAADSEDGEALRVIVVNSNEIEDCECCCRGCDYCDVDCESECCCACNDNCENTVTSESTPKECKSEHAPECTCDECRVEQTPTEDPIPETKPEKPIRKSKKQSE